MICRLIRIDGALRFVFFVPADCDAGFEGCPLPSNRGAWRRSIYRPPLVQS